MSRNIEDKNGKKYISFSQVNMFLQCGKKYEYKYIDKIKGPLSGAMMLGIKWHETIEENYRQKIKTKRDLDVEYLKEFFSNEWDTVGDNEEVEFEDDPGTMKDLGLGLVELQHAEIAPMVQPISVEEKFKVSLGEDFPYDLLGFWDVIDENHVVIDNKSWKSSKSQNVIDADMQLTAYSLAYRLKYGKIEGGLRVDAILKNKKLKVLQRETTRTNEDCRKFIGIVEVMVSSIQKGTFIPSPNGWWCSEKWCNYWSICKQGGA